MANVEENFPRGGSRPKSLKRPKEEDNLFAVEKAPKRKKSKKERRLFKGTITEDSFHASLKIQGTLSYNKIQEGMVILGCVRHITNFSLEVELPGVVFGYVNISKISDPLVKYLNRTLEDNAEETDLVLKKLFHTGQFLPLKIISLVHNEKGTRIGCSINPKDINEGKRHSSFKKGMLVWGCIQSVLDHGYEVNIGVKNCRVFLPTKNVKENTSLAIGKPFWCTVHKYETTSSVTTLRVSSKEQHINANAVEYINGLDDLMPGIKVEFLTEKVTSTGIQGKFLNDYFGYIDEMYFNTLKKPEDYQEGILIPAYVLYVEPITKVTYLTMWNLESVPAPSHNLGSILSSKIKSKCPTGIYLISSKEKCFVSNKRLIKSLTKKSELSEKINEKYPTGSEHKCRVLDYNHMSRMYICTLEKSVLNEKHFCTSDVQIGQLLNVVIDSIKPEGLVVKTGHIRGFVPNLYVSNVAYSNNMKKKFKEGQKFKARVLNIDDENIILTLKQSQVSSEKCLKSLNQVQRGDRYPGVVIQTKDEGALVVFYNNVKGWIGKKYLTEDKDSGDIDPTQYFYRGQVVNPWVAGVKEQKVILTLRQPAELKRLENLRICQKIRGVVGKIHKDKIDVITKKGTFIGTVPLNHLSCVLSLCPSFLKTFKVGDKLDDLICINNKSQPPLLSRRESLALRRSTKLKVRKFENLKPGNLIRCSYVSSSQSGIYVLPLILDYAERILIKNKDINDEGTTTPSFKIHQSIVTKVVSIDHALNKIHLTMKFSEVFDNRVETAMDYFSQRLADINYLKKFGKDNEWPLCQNEPGDRILCKVDRVGDEGGCVVSLSNGIAGLVAPRLCPDVKTDQTLKGVFVSQNFENNYAEICLKPDICQKINNVQDGLINTSNLSCLAETVLIKEDYVIAVLKPKGCNRQLVYLPLYFHENDFEGYRKHYELNKLKICVCGKVGNSLLGISKKLFLRLDKNRIRVHKEMDTRGSDTRRSESEESIPDDNNVEERREPPSIVFSGLVGDHIHAINGVLLTKEDTEQNENNPNRQADNQVEEETTEDDEEDTNSKENTNSENNEGTTNSEDNEENTNSEDSEESTNSEENAENTSNEGDEENTSNEDNIAFTKQTSDKEVSKVDLKRKLPSTSGVSSANRSLVLPGTSSFFNCSDKQEEESSSDEEEEQEVVKKKKKLTPAERAQLARQEEERISKIEKELADSVNTPENIEQFDRLLVAHPNSSELWLKYMSFHIAGTEFEKARTVAKRALEAIDMTLINERFNIWIALLNMENMFGTMESFEKTFEDALKYNDSLEIYLKVIQMLAEAGKITEMEEKIRKARNKHKQDPNMWLEIAKTYYLINKYREARNLREASLKSIQDKRNQMEIIVKFAIMEFKYGEEDQGAAIFETILSTDPKKVNIWITYVDQLVKKNRIEEARRVLERATSQHLSVKHMKTLFFKFRMFEEQHGTPPDVEGVKQSAKEYFVRVSKKM